MTYDIKFSHVVATLLDSFSTSAEAGSVHASQRVISDCHPAGRISVEYSLRTQFRRPFSAQVGLACETMIGGAFILVCRCVGQWRHYSSTMAP